VNVSNVLSEEKKKQVIALGQLGWTLRRIEKETGIRRETAAGYLKAAGITVRSSGRWGHPTASEVTTDPGFANPSNGDATNSAPSKPAIEVTTDSGAENGAPVVEAAPTRSPSASACEPFHELIELGISRGRNAMGIWQDLVDQSAFVGIRIELIPSERRRTECQPGTLHAIEEALHHHDPRIVSISP
jgi:hypothetical protein